jgi:hypothetical protein
MAEFPSVQVPMYRWINEYTCYPGDARFAGISGIVYVQFVI